MEEAATSVINLISGEGNQLAACESDHTLGNVRRFKREVEKAIHDCNMAFNIASSFDWHDQLFWVHYALEDLLRYECRFDDAHSHPEHAKPPVVNDAYQMGRAGKLEARVWFKQCRLEVRVSACRRHFREDRSCGKLLQIIRVKLDSSLTSGQSRNDGESL